MGTRDYTLLIVDDDEGVREVLARRLEGPRRTVLSAGTGLAALETARARKPDIIILDLLMPDMDGDEVCAQLRLDDATRDIPIVMLSGLGRIGPELAGLVSKADGYLPKPVDLDDLDSCVEVLLSQERRPQGGIGDGS